MSELRECPFCGSHNEKPINHAEDCFIRMYAENVDEYYYSGTLVHDRESMKEAWNTRAERTCEPVKKFSEESPWPRLVCSECGRELHWDDIVNEVGEESAELQPYCGCGAKVVSE